jgi:hypothetical protein
MTTGAMTPALVLDGVRAMTTAQREELRHLLGVGVHDDRRRAPSANGLAR